ncbi:MAG: IS3 family transposase [Burkholderia sp.]
MLAPVRRGPKPKAPDHERLAAVRADLTRTLFVGEGARKVWARLRIQDDIRVSRARVSPLMREHGLLSPHRQPQKPLNAHDGRMTTNRPNERWGADGAKVQTVDEGLVWIFAAVDHCDAACVGIHVTKVGDRFAALEPISQGVREQFGSVEADAGRGLSLRMDHGSQYRSDDLRAQLKFWGITLS